jgi:predicted Zn-dependent peptidase
VTRQVLSAVASTVHFPVGQWRLANGLRVVVQPDHRWPLVASMMCYDAGSRKDPASRSGLTHLCEHLAFDGPHPASRDAFAERIESLGGSARATTTNDRLCFSAVVPSRELASVLAVEAERMARPFDVENGDAVEIQRRVLLQELRGRSQSRLRAAAFEQIHRLLFAEDHPYHRPPAGEADGIAAVTLDDVRAFARHFAPSNAVLVIVGNVSIAAAAEMVGRAFDDLPAGVEATPETSASRSSSPSGRSQRVPAAVSRTLAHVAWSIPGFGQAEWYLASLLVRGLASGYANPLAWELVGRTGLAQEVHGHLLAMRDACTLTFDAVAARGVDNARLEQGLADALDRLLASGLSAAALARARKKTMSEHYIVVQSIERRADLCASLSCYLDAADRVEEEAERYRDADAADVAAFASGLRRQSDRVVLSLVPQAEAA